MNNRGIDMEIWKRLRKKWTELDKKGQQLKIDLQLIADPNDAKKILAIDVIQQVDGKTVTETVQRSLGEGYAPLGIGGLSREALQTIYKQMMKQLSERSALNEIDVIVTMSLRSSTSGELQGYLEIPNATVQSSILLDYQYYYVLNALRDKMTEQSGENWNQVRTVYHNGDVDFYFEYS